MWGQHDGASGLDESMDTGPQGSAGFGVHACGGLVLKPGEWPGTGEPTGEPGKPARTWGEGAASSQSERRQSANQGGTRTTQQIRSKDLVDFILHTKSDLLVFSPILLLAPQSLDFICVLTPCVLSFYPLSFCSILFSPYLKVLVPSTLADSTSVLFLGSSLSAFFLLLSLSSLSFNLLFLSPYFISPLFVSLLLIPSFLSLSPPSLLASFCVVALVLSLSVVFLLTLPVSSLFSLSLSALS